jgi:hypothetical protein
LRQLASSPRQNRLAAALQRAGRLERTLFTLAWLGMRNCALRPGTQQGRNTQQPGAGCLHPIASANPRPHYENEQHRASGPNLLVTSIILWNTRYLEGAAPLCARPRMEHVNLTGTTSGAPSNRSRNAVTDSVRSGLRPIPLTRPPEFVVCPLAREIRAFRYFWPGEQLFGELEQFLKIPVPGSEAQSFVKHRDLVDDTQICRRSAE